MLKRIWTKIMETSSQFLQRLKQQQMAEGQAIIERNKKALAEQEAIAAQSLDPIGSLIQSAQDEEDRALLDKMFAEADKAPVTPTPSVGTAPAPKVPEGRVPTIAVGPSQSAPASANTTVLAQPQSPVKINVAGQKAKPFTGEITPEVIKQFTQQFRVPNDQVTSAILKAAKTTGMNPELLFRVARAESNFRPAVKAQTSSATGLFQFIDKTWDYVMKDLGGKENFGLKGNRKDAYENAVAASIYFNEIKRNLAPARKSGEFSVGELYLGHFAGPGTARRVISLVDKGEGDKPASTVFSRQALNANKNIFYKPDGKMRTLEEVIQRVSERVS